MKNKKNIIGVLSLVLVLLLIIFGICLSIDNNISESKSIAREYEKLNNKRVDGKKYPKVNIPDNNIIKYTSIDEILEIFNDKRNAVIYFGYPSCVYCRSAIQVLVDTASTTKLNTIYYLDTEQVSEGYDKLLDTLDDQIVLNEEGKRELPLPLVLFITNGEIISYNKGTLFSHDDPYEELNESQVEGLSEIYKYGIFDVLTY